MEKSEVCNQLSETLWDEHFNNKIQAEHWKNNEEHAERHGQISKTVCKGRHMSMAN